MTTDINDLTLAQRNLVKTATGRLKDEFAGIFAAETIERFIADSLDQLLGTAKVTTFVPIFVERFTRDRLQGAGQGRRQDRDHRDPQCCSCASTTPVARRWRRRG